MLKLSRFQVAPPICRRSQSDHNAVLWFYPPAVAFRHMQALHYLATHGSAAHAALYSRFHECALGQFVASTPAGQSKIANTLFAYLGNATVLNGLLDLALSSYLFVSENPVWTAPRDQASKLAALIKTINADLGNGKALIYDGARHQFKSVILKSFQTSVARDRQVSLPLLTDPSPIRVAGVQNADEATCRKIVGVATALLGAAAGAAAGYGVGRAGGKSGVGDSIAFGFGGAVAAGERVDTVLDTLGVCGGASSIDTPIDPHDSDYLSGYGKGITDALQGGPRTDSSSSFEKNGAWTGGYADGYNSVGVPAGFDSKGPEQGDYSAGFASGFASATGTTIGDQHAPGGPEYDQGVRDGQDFGRKVSGDESSVGGGSEKTDGATTDTPAPDTGKPSDAKDSTDTRVAENDTDKSRDTKGPKNGEGTPNPDDPEGGGPWSDIGTPDPDGPEGGGPASRRRLAATALQSSVGWIAQKSFSPLTAKAVASAKQSVQLTARLGR